MIFLLDIDIVWKGTQVITLKIEKLRKNVVKKGKIVLNNRKNSDTKQWIQSELLHFVDHYKNYINKIKYSNRK